MSSYQSFMNNSVLLVVSGINRTYIDIVFTLIASSEFSNETYALMETTAKQFIEEYEYVNYYVIAYVDGVLKMVNFSFGANESNAAARRARRAVGASEPLISVLEEALVAFQNNSLGESNNRKALVVMTDISSSADKNSLEKAVRPIEESGILVISVSIGAVNRTELLVISPNPLDVISVDKNLQPLQLANRIGERIIRKNHFLLKNIIAKIGRYVSILPIGYTLLITTKFKR